MRRPTRLLATAALILFALGSQAHAVIDDNATKQIWKLKYGVSDAQIADSGWLNADSDGDGLKNGDEIAAGTNPFDNAKTIKVLSVVRNGANVELQFPTENGKRYRVESTATLLNAGSWVIQAGQATGDGTTKMLSVPYVANNFYRVRVDDLDTDTDGVSNWAELAVTLDPNDMETEVGVNDHDYVNEQIALPSVVSITAETPFASEDGPTPGKLTVTRTQNLFPITVIYGTSGTAVPGTDYAALSGSVGFVARGSTTQEIAVTPTFQAAVDGGKSVTATLIAPGAVEFPFTLGTPSSATVIINESIVPTGTGLLAQYYNTASTTYTNSANFNPAELKITRVDPTVNFDWLYGTPNGAVINTANSPDNYSVVWEGNLSPTTAGSYVFQLDADDKARVLLDTGSGLVEILEHGWDGATTPETVGTFKQSAAFSLAVPATPANRYRIRVEMVESTGDARCRLQWRRDTGAFADIPSAQVFSHTSAATYMYTKDTTTTGTAVVTLSGHTLGVGSPVDLNFSAGNLYTPTSYSGSYTVTAVTATTFTVGITGAAVPNTDATARACFVGNSASTTAGWLARYYPNTGFTTPPTLVRVDTAVTNGNASGIAGVWGAGSPDPLIAADTFSIRWTGQVQPQFSEEYTFVVNCDDGVKLWINGQLQTLKAGATSSSAGTYSYDSATGNTVITHTNIPPNSFVVGETVRVDFTNGNLTSLAFADYPVIAVTPTTFTINVAGAFATGTGTCNIEWINKPMNDWASLSNIDRYVRIPVIGGTRYDIQLDYYENTSNARCQLSWYSLSQPKQIIPAARLYPSTGDLAPAAHTSPTDATALVGGLFTYQILGSNGAAVSVSGNPAWLTYGAGVLSGTPPPGAAGDYQVIITVTNAAGTSTSVLNLHVEDTGGTIAREYWNGVAGTTVASIPTGSNPTGTANLTSLEAPTNFGDDYGARIRGYITAPTTGNYYFWVAASDAAELWISNDDEPISAFKRAWVTTGNATPQTWSGEASQKSPWLALEQGQRYYIEILHKAGVGAGDNLAIGWAKPGESDTAPSGVVPGYVLSPYVAPALGSTPGTLYVATMLSQTGAITNGVGTSTFRLSEDENYGYMKRSFSGLTGGITAEHIHTDPYLTHASLIVFDIDEPATPGDGLITNPSDPNYTGTDPQTGTYKWTILPVGTLSKADIIEIIKQGKAYINLHTAAYPNGEIRGNYTLAVGSRTFTPPPAPPAWTDDHDTDAGAVRFLTQATFGARISDVQALRALPSYEAWIDDQFTKPASVQLPEVIRTEAASAQGGAFNETLTFNAWWWNSIAGDDQLRQRIAFALSEIHVVSGQGPLDNNARALSYFYDKLAQNAFGNFRDILEDTTLTPSMGRYLDMLRNDKPDLAVGRIPNENYAREIKQLFSVGLYRQWPDGTLMLTSKDAPIDTYTQREIVGFAHVFTGWDYGYDGAFRTALNAPADWTRQMREVPARHFTGPKRILNNVVLPGLKTVAGQSLDPYATHNTTSYNNASYQALPAQELDASHDQLFNHPNVGPFICRQLIQRLVTSNPSRDYLYRVVQKFNDNGSGVRGDMKAVIKAILLDFEARSSTEATKPAFGKQREPVMRVAAAARAFRIDSWAGTYSQAGTRAITVTITTPAAIPHKLISGNPVFLDFTSTADTVPKPWIGAYTVANPVTASTFTVNAAGWVTATYSIPANSTTCTVTQSSHWLQTGHKIYVDFTSGAADGDAGLDGVVYTLASATAETGAGNFTFAIDPLEVSATARTGSLMLPRFSPGSFTSASSGLPAPNDRRVTMDTNTDHHLNVGDQVQINFYGGNPQPLDMVVTVESVMDLNTYTFLATATGTNLGNNQGNNSVYQFPLVTQPLTRTGNVGSRPSTFSLNNTDTVLDQTPLNAPTVFNYYLPDYKFPGTLASQGLTTPEFQRTAETSVVRQSNYIYDGIFNPSNTNGISSFSAGNNALLMDYGAWMPDDATSVGLGLPSSTTLPWTHNQNIVALIEQFNTLLTAGQLSAQAKTIIRNLVSLPISSISTGNPCTVTTSSAHGYATGNLVVVSGVSNGTFAPTLNSTTTTQAVTVTGANTFTIPVDCTAAPNATGLMNAHVSQIVYNNGTTTPSTTNRRDRLRAIIHLILTSPDFTIQR